MESKKKKIVLSAAAALVVVVALFYYLFFASFSSKGETSYVYIRQGDGIDSVYARLDRAASPSQMLGFKLLASCTGYANKIRAGRYGITPSIGSLRLFRNLRNGRQTPVELTVPIVRTKEKLAAKLAEKLEPDSTDFAKCFSDEKLCEAFDCDTATLPCLFIPNTYEIYWDVTPEQLLKRMKKESDAFWNKERKRKAAEAGLSPFEVITLASIVEQETANNAEKPMIAGMYINRLRQGMKLKADPTVKFAAKRFELRRVGGDLLNTDSPYNTYKYRGLPPGPICIPSLASINAVLNFAHHNYLFMCAKEDFSGTHNFAATGEEHMQNAKKYADALNKKGIEIK